MGTDNAELLNEREAAAFLRVAQGTLQQWRAAGKGPPFHRLGRTIRYDREALRMWLLRNVVAVESKDTVR